MLKYGILAQSIQFSTIIIQHFVPMILKLYMLLHARLGTADLTIPTLPQQLVHKLHLSEHLVAQCLVVAQALARRRTLVRFCCFLCLYFFLEFIPWDKAGAGELSVVFASIPVVRTSITLLRTSMGIFMAVSRRWGGYPHIMARGGMKLFRPASKTMAL